MRVSTPVWTAALAVAALPVVNAFYPYSPENGNGANGNVKRGQTAGSQPSAPYNGRSITLPIRRVPSRRDNIYNILKSNDPKQKNSVAIDQDGNDLSYMVAVTFGDSKEEYHLLLDSAASNTWVMAQDCQTAACGTHTLFGEGDSSTLETDSSTTFNVSYGTGTVRGTVASDTLHIGGLTPSLTFGLATEVSEEFRAYPMDGILGIGRGSKFKGNIEAPQVMEVLTSSNLIGSKLYGVYLNRAEDGLNDGEFNLGEPNKERYDGDLNNIPLIENDKGFWEIKVDDVGVDNVELGISGRTAFIDTGTSFMFLPEDDATAIHDLIPGYTKSGESYTVPCDTDKAIWISFGDQKYNISAADWVGGETDGGCRSNIIGRTTFGETQWLLGDVFMKNVYTVFDFDNSQIGFGVKGGEGAENQETPTSTVSGTPSATGTTDPSATGLQTTPADDTQEGQDSPPSAAATDSAARASHPSTSLLLSIALGLFSLYL